jgi:hypothetical protein
MLPAVELLVTDVSAEEGFASALQNTVFFPAEAL